MLNINKCTITILNCLSIFSILILFSCKMPVDPEKNPDVVKAKIFILDQDIVEGIPASFGISVTYPMHVECIAVAFDEVRLHDTIVYCKTKTAKPETLVVKFSYPEATVSQKIKAAVKLTNGKVLEIETAFKVRKKNLDVSFVSTPKPHLAAVSAPDTLLFIAKTSTSFNDILFKTSSKPLLDENNLKLFVKKDSATIIVIPKEKNVYTINCYALYGDASDSTNVAVTAFESPLFTTASGNEKQIVGKADTLFFILSSNSPEFQFSLLDSSSYIHGVLSSIKHGLDKISFLFTPNEIKTYSFSLLVKKENLADTITWQRMVIDSQKPLWNKESQSVAAVEGKEIIFPFASCLTDTLKAISFTTSKGTIVGYSLNYAVPWGSASTDTITIDATNNGVISSFKLLLNIAPSDSVAPVIVRVNPAHDTINTDKITCEFTISDVGAGVGDVKFERDAGVIIGTDYADGLYKCTITGLKNGEIINLKVTASDKSMKKNSSTSTLKLFVVKADTAKEITYFGIKKPEVSGTIDKTTKKIVVTVPYGTDVRSLAAVFTTTGVSVLVGTKEQKSDTTVNDFTTPVRYKVIAADKSSTEYEVTVSVASAGKNADLSGLTVSTGSLTPAFSAEVTLYTVNVANSVENITVTGAPADTNAIIEYSPSQKVDLSVGENTITVNVTAQDSTTKKKYEIKVIRSVSSSREITSFGFDSPKAEGIIDISRKTVSVTVPYGTDVKTLIARFTTTGTSVKIGNTEQVSGKTVNNFTDSVTYAVTAADGSKQEYVVTVSFAPYDFTVSFDDQNATAKPVPSIMKVIEPATTVGNLPVEPKKDNYKFGGWYTGTNGTGDLFTGTTPVIKNITVYAKWNMLYKVFYFGNGNDDGVVPVDNNTYQQDDGIIVKRNTGNIQKDGYTFNGWNTKADSSGVSYPVDGTFKMSNANTNLYAKWAIITYHITYLLDGGTNDTTNTKSYTIESNDINLKGAKKGGYDFGGWYLESDYITPITTLPKGSVGPKTLYAKWSPHEYNITYVLNGGSNIANPPTVYTIESPLITLPVATKTSYTFEGWYTDDACNTPKMETIPKGSIGDKKYYAKWIIVDKDGNIYTEIKIGNQVWMVENLRTTKYNDGNPIPHVPDSIEWSNLSTPGYCLYSNNAYPNYKAYWGVLYNWYTISTGKLSIEGWRVPTAIDWDSLENYLIANKHNYDGTTAGNMIAKAMATQTDWANSMDTGAIGNEQEKNNSSRFSALPGGCRESSGGFNSQRENGYWWTATGFGVFYAWERQLSYKLNHTYSYGYFRKGNGFSVRLIRVY